MKKFRLLSLCLAVSMLLTLSMQGTVLAESNILFSNPDNEVYVNILNKLGIFSFYGESGLFFEDQKPVKRYEAAKALASLLGYDTQKATGTVSHLFIDVPDYYEYAPVISVVVNNGLMNGTGGGEFRPEDEMKVEHFLKSVVIALGYDYMAKVKGGYPDGYTVVARELDLLEGVTATGKDTLTREVMIRILYNSLDVDISTPDVIGTDYTQYSVTEGVTLLTQYHDVYTNEDIVKSNTVLSLEPGFDIGPDRVLIGNDTLRTDSKEIFSQVGCLVKYYYRDFDGKKELVYFETLEDNTIYKLSPRDVVRADVSEIDYEDLSGKIKTIKVNANAKIFLNGTPLLHNIAQKLSSFSDALTVIDNNSDKKADVILIEDYTYDIVDFVDTEKEVLYLKNSSVNYGKKDYLKVTNAEGNDIDISELVKGAIVGVGEQSNSDTVVIVSLGLPQALTIDTVSDTEVTTPDGNTYYIHGNLSSDMERFVKPGSEIAAAISLTGDIVWADESDMAVRIGYLIQTGESSNGFDTEVALKILTQSGEIILVGIDDKIIINDESIRAEDVKAYLKGTKAKLNTASDGETSQLIYYTIKEDGSIASLYTAGTDSHSKFVLKYNFNEQGDAFLRDHGYGSAVYASGYALSDVVPIFQIPQNNIEAHEDKYFTVTKYAPASFKDGASFKFESYVNSAMDIVPTAMVYYKTGTAELSKSNDFFLVESVRNVVNSEGESAIRLTGFTYNSEKTYFVSTSYEDMPEVAPGDICIMARDGIDEIIQLEKVYDLSTNTVTPGYEGASRGDTVAVRVLHVYNAPEGSEFIETYEGGFENGVPGDENKVLFNFRPSSRTKRDLFTFNIEKEDAHMLQPEKITDYLHDPENYARIVVRFGNNYQGDAVIYQ